MIENDVRLLRRALICRYLRMRDEAEEIEKYLANKNLRFAYREASHMLAGLRKQDAWLAVQYGYFWLPDHLEIIFLNSKWANPRTLYVRLCEEVPELGDLGVKIYTPRKLLGTWEKVAEGCHQRYEMAFEPKRSFWKRLWGSD